MPENIMQCLNCGVNPPVRDKMLCERCAALLGGNADAGKTPIIIAPEKPALSNPAVDMVNSPPHYRRGPTVCCPNCGHSWTLQCIDVIRHIKDGRLFTATKYIWRVAFGGKHNDHEDIDKARWYLQDWLDNHV